MVGIRHLYEKHFSFAQESESKHRSLLDLQSPFVLFPLTSIPRTLGYATLALNVLTIHAQLLKVKVVHTQDANIARHCTVEVVVVQTDLLNLR